MKRTWSRGWAVALVFGAAVTLNSGVTLYGRIKLRDFAKSMTLQLQLPNLVGNAIPDVTRTQNTNTNVVQVDVNADLSCARCQELEPKIDSARKYFGKAIKWRCRYAADPRSLRSVDLSMIGACVGDSTGPWGLWSELSQAEKVDSSTISAAVASLGVSASSLSDCLEDTRAAERIWSDVFRTAALHRAVPSIEVNGANVRGELTYESIVRSIMDEISVKVSVRPFQG